MTTEGRRHSDTERHTGLGQQGCGDQAQRLALAFWEASTPEGQGASVEVCVWGGVSRAAAQPVRTGVDTGWLFQAPRDRVWAQSWEERVTRALVLPARP